MRADIGPLGNKVVHKWFTKYPHHLQLFPFRDAPDLTTDPRSVAHGKSVLSAVGAVVSGMRDVEALSSTIDHLAVVHMSKGVHRDMFPALNWAIMSTLEEALGPEWTAEVAGAWESVFEKLAARINEAMEQAAQQEAEAKNNPQEARGRGLAAAVCLLPSPAFFSRGRPPGELRRAYACPRMPDDAPRCVPLPSWRRRRRRRTTTQRSPCPSQSSVRVGKPHGGAGASHRAWRAPSLTALPPGRRQPQVHRARRVVQQGEGAGRPPGGQRGAHPAGSGGGEAGGRRGRRGAGCAGGASVWGAPGAACGLSPGDWCGGG